MTESAEARKDRTVERYMYSTRTCIHVYLYMHAVHVYMWVWFCFSPEYHTVCIQENKAVLVVELVDG